MNRSSIITGNYETREVKIDGMPLSHAASLKLSNHSPDGFAWGYGGSGPSQLALALLQEAVTDELAIRYYQDFKWAHIATLPHEDFEMKASEIYDWFVKNVSEELAKNHADLMGEIS